VKINTSGPRITSGQAENVSGLKTADIGIAMKQPNG